MEKKRIIKEIKRLIKPLKNIDEVKAIWIYGSFITKKGFKETSDIDILILIDDTKEISGLLLKKIQKEVKSIEDRGDQLGIRLHFQPPKFLTFWWDLIRHGEPWTITSLKSLYILYDPSDYIKLIHNLLKKKKIYSTEEKMETLIERAEDNMNKVRSIMLNDTPAEILKIITESAQIILMYEDKFVIDPDMIIKELKKLVNKDILTRECVDIYEEIVDIVEKIRDGYLTKFTGKDLDRFLKKSKEFISKTEEAVAKIEEIDKKEKIKEVYMESMRLCEKALEKIKGKKEIKKIPKSDLDKIRYFKKYFIDPGLIDKTHLETLKELYDYIKRKKNVNINEDKYTDKIHLRSLELALKNIIS